ncbi:hypothetical protein NE237_013909 [Protea cynaroides]|uniref:Uncharacterized protein n=1 Tax=Protea cynaroides TaxID=273540 RepID=A0A9Q0GZJ5_9MAGN|nr:hypothetical protein NE237_013909 [Protea cynaroides]
MQACFLQGGSFKCCECSPQKPGERSKLWKHDDALDVLKNLIGTDAVEGLEFGFVGKDSPSYVYQIIFIWGALLFSTCNGAKNSKKFGREPCVSQSRRSSILGGSDSLTYMPSFPGLPNYEILILKGCGCLVVVHESIGHLSKLVDFDLRGCGNLRNLSSLISNLSLLEKLDISHCGPLEKLPEGIWNLIHLKVLDAVGMGLDLTSSLGLQKNLTTFTYCSSNYLGKRRCPKSTAMLLQLLCMVSAL